MSKDFIMNYARGEMKAPACLVVFSVENGGIVIHSCEIIQGQTESVLIKKTYDNQECTVSETDVLQAAAKYMAADR